VSDNSSLTRASRSADFQWPLRPLESRDTGSGIYRFGLPAPQSESGAMGESPKTKKRGRPKGSRDRKKRKRNKEISADRKNISQPSERRQEIILGRNRFRAKNPKTKKTESPESPKNENSFKPQESSVKPLPKKALVDSETPDNDKKEAKKRINGNCERSKQPVATVAAKEIPDKNSASSQKIFWKPSRKTSGPSYLAVYRKDGGWASCSQSLILEMICGDCFGYCVIDKIPNLLFAMVKGTVDQAKKMPKNSSVGASFYESITQMNEGIGYSERVLRILLSI